MILNFSNDIEPFTEVRFCRLHVYLFLCLTSPFLSVKCLVHTEEVEELRKVKSERNIFFIKWQTFVTLSLCAYVGRIQ